MVELTLRRSIAAVLVVLGSLGSGCYSTPEGFARRAAKLDCVRFEECAKVTFEQQFDDIADCRDEIEDETEDLIDDLEDAGCDYDPEEGRECIHAAYENRKDCSQTATNEISDACGDRIFDCPGGIESAPVMLPLYAP